MQRSFVLECGCYLYGGMGSKEITIITQRLGCGGTARWNVYEMRVSWLSGVKAEAYQTIQASSCGQDKAGGLSSSSQDALSSCLHHSHLSLS